MTIPDGLSHVKEDILITLRALAGIVAKALRRAATSGDAATLAWRSSNLAFWRGLHRHHTRRLVPRVSREVGASTRRAFVDQLIHTIYLEDHDVDRDHGVAPRHAANPALPELLVARETCV